MRVMPRSSHHAMKCRLVNSGPLSQRILFGLPRPHIVESWVRYQTREVESMTWAALDSDMLSAAAYDVGKQMLYLRFRKTGHVYRYFDFPKENYREFLDAESHGHYFLNHIRHNYRYERLARLTAA